MQLVNWNFCKTTEQLQYTSQCTRAGEGVLVWALSLVASSVQMGALKLSGCPGAGALYYFYLPLWLWEQPRLNSWCQVSSQALPN